MYRVLLLRFAFAGMRRQRLTFNLNLLAGYFHEEGSGLMSVSHCFSLDGASTAGGVGEDVTSFLLAIVAKAAVGYRRLEPRRGTRRWMATMVLGLRAASFLADKCAQSVAG